jgi:hypothetical protein
MEAIWEENWCRMEADAFIFDDIDDDADVDDVDVDDVDVVDVDDDDDDFFDAVHTRITS